jgi:hypothetical protein
MNNVLDLERLARALDEAIAAVPIESCKSEQPEVRRACQEMALYLLHLKEMAARLQTLKDREPAG